MAVTVGEQAEINERKAKASMWDALTKLLSMGTELLAVAKDELKKAGERR